MTKLPLPLRLYLERHDMTAVLLPGTPTTWAVFSQKPTQLLTYKKGRWTSTSPTLQTLLRNPHEQPTHPTQTRRSRRNQKRSA